MFKKLTLAGAALAMGTVAMAPTEAAAQRYYGDRYERAYGYNDGYYRQYRGDRRYYQRNRRCSNGTTGTVLGAIAGGLLGRVVDTRGDRLPGTLIGGAAGALAGRAIEKSDNPRFCR